MDEPTCSECGATGRLKRGRCENHYRIWMRQLKARGESPPKGRNRLVYPCDVEGCEEAAGYKRLCLKHRETKNRTGDPLTPDRRRIKRPAIDRFLEKVDKNGPVPVHRPDLGPCWVWTGAKGPLGYGRMSVDSKTTQVHRFAYEHYVKPIPEGLDVDHVCRNPSCVNAPGGHLEPVTHRENVRRGIAPSAVNAAKTHCKNGHEFTPENTHIKIGHKGKQMRICRACRRKPREEWLTKPKGSKTHCRHGHEYTPENTWIAPGSGSKYCRACMRDRREKARKAA